MDVIDHTAAHRYELVVDGEVVAIEEYRLRGDRLTLTHAETFEGHEGHGLARVLADGVLADARRRGLAVVPQCPYVRTVIARNPTEYLDLVPAGLRARFGLPD